MRYYINKKSQANGDHEVHTENCIWLPSAENRIYLGEFMSCYQALCEAKKIYANADGCAHCCPACHHS